MRRIMPLADSTINDRLTAGLRRVVAQHRYRLFSDSIGQIPSDLVVDRGASSVGGSLILGFPCTPILRPRHLSEINISNINMLKVYH
jgi:hypothetical protein